MSFLHVNFANLLLFDWTEKKKMLPPFFPNKIALLESMSRKHSHHGNLFFHNIFLKHLNPTSSGMKVKCFLCNNYCMDAGFLSNTMIVCDRSLDFLLGWGMQQLHDLMKKSSKTNPTGLKLVRKTLNKTFLWTIHMGFYCPIWLGLEGNAQMKRLRKRTILTTFV